jgi:hypothetical protein
MQLTQRSTRLPSSLFRVYKQTIVHIQKMEARQCTIPGCFDAPQHPLLDRCKKHSGPLCTVADCFTKAVPPHYLRCSKHNPHGKCSVLGCTTNAHKAVSKKDPTKPLYCGKHDPDKKQRAVCKFEGCSTQSQSGSLGFCKKHGTYDPAVSLSFKKLCFRKGCTRAVRSRGLCGVHGRENTALAFELAQMAHMAPMSQLNASFADWVI